MGGGNADDAPNPPDGGADDGGAGQGDTTCPVGWFVVDMMNHADGAIWRFAGDNTNGANLARGSCGGGGANSVFQFTAPADGQYNVTIEAQNDTLLYARSDCDSDARGAELACNDDYDGVLSGIEFVLEAGESAYVFVDSFGGGTSGPFTIRIAPGPLP